jgi:hypothetical protein
MAAFDLAAARLLESLGRTFVCLQFRHGLESPSIAWAPRGLTRPGAGPFEKQRYRGDFSADDFEANVAQDLDSGGARS